MSNIINTYNSFPWDADAKLYMDAHGSLSALEKVTTNNRVIALKDYELWDKLSVIYQFFGANASGHKWNLKDARDLDAAFRLSFYGGITHNSNELKGNGSNAYADTHYSPATHQTVNSQSLTIQVTTNNSGVTANPVEIGALAAGPDLTEASAILLSPNYVAALNNLDSAALDMGSTSGTKPGVYTATRNGSSNIRGFKNGTLLSNGTTSGTLPTENLFLLNANVGGSPFSAGWSNQGLGFVAIGNGLSDTDVANLYDIITNY